MGRRDLAPGRGLAALRVALALAFPVPDVRPANGFGFVLGLTPPFKKLLSSPPLALVPSPRFDLDPSGNGPYSLRVNSPSLSRSSSFKAATAPAISFLDNLPSLSSSSANRIINGCVAAFLVERGDAFGWDLAATGLAPALRDGNLDGCPKPDTVRHNPNVIAIVCFFIFTDSIMKFPALGQGCRPARTIR